MKENALLILRALFLVSVMGILIFVLAKAPGWNNRNCRNEYGEGFVFVQGNKESWCINKEKEVSLPL